MTDTMDRMPHDGRSRKATILCVEDEIDLRSDIVEELAGAGYRVFEAGNGLEALAVIASERPDLILCDVTMPKLGGYEFMACLRAEHPDLADVPFIFLTALADRSEVLEGKQAGADDYLVKPVDFDDLLATVASRLRFVDRVRRSLLQELDIERQRVIERAAREGEVSLALLGAALDHVAVGMFILEETGHVRLMNRDARALVEAGEDLMLSPAGLSARSPAASRQLRAAISTAVQDSRSRPVLGIERAAGQPVVLQLSLVTLPATNSRYVVVLAVDPDRTTSPAPEALMNIFSCTATEARLAAALASGKRVEEIGEEFGVKPTTITFHLQNLFQKTHTNRQVDLIALLIRATLPLKG